MVGLVVANSAQWITTLLLALAHGWHRLNFAHAVPWPLIANTALGALACGMMAWSSYQFLEIVLDPDHDPTLVQELVLVLGPTVIGGLAYAFVMWSELSTIIARLRSQRSSDVTMPTQRAR
jgi:hypothetical protein